jgi:hypothetical protein
LRIDSLWESNSDLLSRVDDHEVEIRNLKNEKDRLSSLL